CPHEFGDSVGVESLETADGGFGNDDAGVVEAEVVGAVDEAGGAVHDEAVSLGGGDIEDDVPALTGRKAAPVVVANDDAAVFGVAAGGGERAAMVAGPGGVGGGRGL